MPYDFAGDWYDDDPIPGQLSPWEQAHGGQAYDPANTAANAPNDFDRATSEYYQNYPGGHPDPTQAPVNWYQPETYSWLTNPTTAPGPGPSGGSNNPGDPAGGGSTRPGYLDDSLFGGWSGSFSPSRPDLGRATLPTLAAFKPPKLPEVSPFQSPDPFTFKDFQRPDPNTIKDDPTYQFREREGRRGLEASTAAQGLARSGGTLKDLIKYGQQFASNEYQNIYNRDVGEHQLGYQSAADTYDRNFRNLLTTWGENRKTQFDSYDAELRGLLPGYEGEMLSYSTESAAAQRQTELDYDREWQSYLEGRSTFETNQRNLFDRQRWEWEIRAGCRQPGVTPDALHLTAERHDRAPPARQRPEPCRRGTSTRRHLGERGRQRWTAGRVVAPRHGVLHRR